MVGLNKKILILSHHSDDLKSFTKVFNFIAYTCLALDPIVYCWLQPMTEKYEGDLACLVRCTGNCLVYHAPVKARSHVKISVCEFPVMWKCQFIQWFWTCQSVCEEFHTAPSSWMGFQNQSTLHWSGYECSLDYTGGFSSQSMTWGSLSLVCLLRPVEVELSFSVSFFCGRCLQEDFLTRPILGHSFNL